MKTATIALLIACQLPCAAQAGFLDDTADLQGKTIVYAGDIEQVTCPAGGKYDCLQWPFGFYKTKNDACFVTDANVCGFSCRALIAVDASRQLSVFVMPTLGGVKKGSFQSYKCPSLY